MNSGKKERNKPPATVIPPVEDDCDTCSEAEEGLCPKSDVSEEDNTSC